MEKIIISTAVLALAITVCSCQSSAKEDKKPAANNKGQSLKVDAFVVSPRKLLQDIEVPGSLAAFEEVELHTEASGRVTGVYFKEGSNVQQGSVLIKLYDGDLVAQLQKLKVQLASAQQTAERYAALLKINGVSQQEYDLNVLAVNNIKADIAITETSISKTSLRAPFSGKMGITTITPGAYLSPATPIATLRKISQLKLQFMVPEKYISGMKPGSMVQFSIENSPAKYKARISATENTVASDSRSLTVKAIVENPSAQLLAGVFAKVQIPLGEEDAALMIPTQAVIPQTRDKKVLAVRNGVASMETVTTGLRDSANVEITSGLKAGDTVLITGLLATKPGTKVAFNKVYQ